MEEGHTGERIGDGFARRFGMEWEGIFDVHSGCCPGGDLEWAEPWKGYLGSPFGCDQLGRIYSIGSIPSGALLQPLAEMGTTGG